MKKKLQIAACVLLLTSLENKISTAFAQGTAFTYQGVLKNSNGPVNGSYDVSFSLYSDSTGATLIAGPVAQNGIGVTNGLFTTTVDFGNVFNATSGWLELTIKTNGAPNAIPPLSPRQQLTPTPYAVRAETVNGSGITGTVPAANLPVNTALIDASQTFSGLNTFNDLHVAGTLTANSYVGDGSGLTGIALLNANNTFSTDQLIIGQVTAGGPFAALTMLDRFHPVNGFGWQWVSDATGLNAERYDGGGGKQLFTLTTNGTVGLGTLTPNSDSLLQVKGMMRMGSETGTSEAPSKPLMLRRINSTSSSVGQVVARGLTAGGAPLTLERDGTPGGLVFKGTGSPGDGQIVGFGISVNNNFVGVQSLFYGNADGSFQVFTDAQKISYLRLSFGDAANPADLTTVEMMRAVDVFGNNLGNWIGTVTSTVNQ